MSHSDPFTLNVIAPIWVWPSKEICTFIRDEIVNERKACLWTLEQLPDLEYRLDQCMRFWNDREKPKGGLVTKTFEDLRVVLSKKGKPALTHGMGRMWPEDFMLLQPGDEVTMLISPIHDNFFGRK